MRCGPFVTVVASRVRLDATRPLDLLVPAPFIVSCDTR
jgi:hypothetical protein